MLAGIAALAARQSGAWQRGMDLRRTELRAAMRALPARDELLADPRQRLDTLEKRLPRALHANAQLHRTHFMRAAARLTPRLLRPAFDPRWRNRRGARMRDAARALRSRARIAAPSACASAGQLLAAFSYRGVLARGFALVRDGKGRPLRSAAAVSSRMRLEIEFSDGRVAAVADGEAPAAPSAALRAKPRLRGGQGPGGQSSGGQGSLFGA